MSRASMSTPATSIGSQRLSEHSPQPVSPASVLTATKAQFVLGETLTTSGSTVATLDIDCPGSAERGAQSTLMPTVFASGVHFAMSRLITAENSSGVLPTGSAPSDSRRSRISGVRTILAISVDSRVTISFGVAAGARMPNQATVSYPGKPDSCTVGTSGSSGERVRVVTASGRSLPAFTSGSAGGKLTNMAATCPETTSFSAGDEPLYGMCTRSTPAIVLNSSIDMCALLPLPPDA